MATTFHGTILFAAMSFCLVAAPAAGQTDVPERAVPRASEPPLIDGVLDDAVWAEAVLIEDLIQVEPVEGARPSQRTEVRLLVDSVALYIGARCYDSNPALIVATQMARDAALESDDHLNIVIDPFFDRRTGFHFSMNAAGARRDEMLDDNSFRPSADWDGIWEGRASIDDEGWTVEIAIPHQTLSFKAENEQWAFNVSRFIRRTNETVQWATPRLNQSVRSLSGAGIISGMTNLNQGKGIDFKPYGVLSKTFHSDGDPDQSEIDGGFDLFYKVTPSLTAAFTVNTDFAETEVDERQVNLTRFPLFFPEKRDFFLQDADVFRFGGIQRSPIPFHSRRIGLGPDGEVIDILAGLKLAGRAGPWNIGLLDVQTDGSDGIDGKNLFVGRASLNVLDESTIGAIITSGDPRSDEDNLLAGVDFNFRDSSFIDDQVFEAHGWFLQSDTEGSGGNQSAWGVKIEWPNDGIRWMAGVDYIGENFNPALGFVPRRGVITYYGDWQYRWRPGNGIRRIDTGFRANLTTDMHHATESSDLSLNLIEVELDSGDELFAEVLLEREVLDDPFEISDGVTIPIGDHSWRRYGAGIRTSRGRPVNLELSAQYGDFYTGTRLDLEAGLDWRVSNHLLLGAQIEQNDVDLPEGDFIVRLARARANVYFTPDVSWTTFAQFDNVSDSLTIHTRVRWIIEPGNELFFVVNQGWLVDNDLRFDPQFTELTTKLGWTFRF